MIENTTIKRPKTPEKITIDQAKIYVEINKMNLHIVLKKLGYEVETEFKFCSNRRFRADWKISKNDKCVLVEYEGVNCHKSRHTTDMGYTMDCEKYNLMTKLGYKLLRYTYKNFNDIIDDLEEVLG